LPLGIGWAKNYRVTSDDPGKKIGAHLHIRGRVQGVYYRASTVQEAQKLGLTGWVMNCPDGSVAAVAQGTRAAIESLIEWCRRGPAGARVDSVEVRWDVFENHFPGFVIKR
jgi:acylphosphatase